MRVQALKGQRRRLSIENCEERALLTTICLADAHEQISSVELLAEVSPVRDVYVDATGQNDGPLGMTHRISAKASAPVFLETTVEFAVPGFEVRALGIGPTNSPTADEGPT